jgi:hypothetical protein
LGHEAVAALVAEAAEVRRWEGQGLDDMTGPELEAALAKLNAADPFADLTPKAVYNARRLQAAIAAATREEDLARLADLRNSEQELRDRGAHPEQWLKRKRDVLRDMLAISAKLQAIIDEEVAMHSHRDRVAQRDGADRTVDVQPRGVSAEPADLSL